MAGNQAVNTNPPNAAEHLSAHGSDWLWAAFSLITLCLLVVTCVTFMVSADYICESSITDLYVFD